MPRAPGLTALGLTGAALALVGAVALTARQDAPPTVAEFSPQAVEQIEEALPEQAEAPSAAGPGDGAAAPEPTASETPTVEPTEVVATPTELPTDGPPVRPCVGTPPRQTEDPQSPPCVNYFFGDNGGATAPGVTGDEIIVALPEASFGGINAPLLQPIVDHFNARYEFYGRKLTIVGFQPNGGTFAHPDPGAMQSDAVLAATEIKAFASLGYVDRKGAEYYYYDELARRGVISVAGRLVNNGTEERLREFAPYQWNVYPAIETAMSLIGNGICATLAGMPPQGGGPTIQAQPERVFGLIVQKATDGSKPPADILRGRLATCGVELAAEHEDQADSADTTGAMLKMQNAGVTSVICLCSVDTAREGYTQAATQQGYLPEWVMSTYLNMDLDNSYHGTTPEQQDNVLGFVLWNNLLPRQQMFWWKALKEQAPGEDPAGAVYYDYAARYHQLLLLASGIQAAGPELTAEAFEAALHDLQFPNPGAGQAPFFQPRVGFEGGRHTMIDSAALFWYSAQDGGTVDPGFPGAVCYVDNGRRFTASSFPTGPQPFFEGPCR